MSSNNFLVPQPVPVQTPGVNDAYEFNEIHLDSNSRDSGTNNEPGFILNTVIHDVIGIKVISAQIPFSYYVFHSGNNTFTLTEPAGGGPHTVTIPVGNYNSSTLATALGTALTGSAGAAIYTVTYSSTTGKFTITSSVAEAFTLTFGDASDKGFTNPRLWLGFNASTNVAAGTGILVAPNVASITGVNYLYITSNLAGPIFKNMRINGASTGDPSVIAEVPVNANPFGVITYSDPSADYSFDYGGTVVQQVTLGLQFGDTFTKIDLNGQPWKVVIGVLSRRKTSLSNFDNSAWGNINTGSKRVRMQ